MSDISLDPEAAAASVARWNAYADAIDQHGQVQHVPIAELQTMVGDIYSPYVTAKAAEYEARTAAYQRVADKARAHAAKLDNTRRTFEQTDEDSGQRIEQAGTMGTTTTPTPPPPVPSAGDPPLDVFKPPQRIEQTALDTEGNVVPGDQEVPYSSVLLPGRLHQTAPSPADGPAVPLI